MKKKNNNLKDLIARLQRFQDWRRGKIDFDDFEWTGYEESKSYSKVNFDNLYHVLLAQFMALSELKDKKEAQEIYFNSILHKEKYFKYATAKDDLQYIYLKSK